MDCDSKKVNKCEGVMDSLFSQNKNSDFCAPLTSFDWNEVDPNLLGTSSIDTTCTIWGLEVLVFRYNMALVIRFNLFLSTCSFLINNHNKTKFLLYVAFSSFSFCRVAGFL